MSASTITDHNPGSSTPTRLNSPDIAVMRAVLHGTVLLPDDPAFAEAIACWALGVRHDPILAVLPETAADVGHAVTFARDHDLPVAVQATGHGIPLPCLGGMLINTRRMQGVVIDPETRVARVEAGVKWSSVLPLAHQHGLAALCGSTSDIGVVGYTLGCGHGWLARKHGRAADRLLAADLVTANGELLRVTEEDHPDLLRALLGGSSNFGIVTAIEFELLPIEQVYGGCVMYPLEQASQVFAAFNDWLPGLTTDITASISIMRFPPLPDLPSMLQGVACVVVRACVEGDLEAGEAMIAPMRVLGEPIIDTFGTIPFPAIDAISMDPVDPMPVISKTVMLPALDDAMIHTLLDVAGPGVASPLLMLELRYLGGADSRAWPVEPGESPRNEAFSAYMIGVAFDDASSAAVEGALNEIMSTIAPFASPRVMLNFLGDRDVGDLRTRAAFSEDEYLRLQSVKAMYDPENRFRFNHNVAPTITEATT